MPIKPGLENVRIVWEVVEERLRTICQRYDRAADALVDVDPKSLGIEE